MISKKFEKIPCKVVEVPSGETKQVEPEYPPQTVFVCKKETIKEKINREKDKLPKNS